MKDSIIYDNSNRIAEFRRMFFDTTATTQIATFNQSNYIFSYSGSATLPSSYLITFSHTSSTLHHLLTHNNLNQPIKDSGLNNISSIYFSYAPNAIVAKHTLILGTSGTRIDSLNLQNGNIVSRYYIFPDNNASNSVDQITYSTLPNPLYNFKGIGALLYAMFQPDFDWISPNLFSSVTNSRNLGNMVIDWKTDTDGNVISGTGTINGFVIQIIFNYD